MGGERLERRLFWAWSWGLVLLLVLGVGCGLAPSVRWETVGDTPSMTSRGAVGTGAMAVEVEEREWREALPELATSARPFTRAPMREAWEFFKHSHGGALTSGEAHYQWDADQQRLVGADARTRALHLEDVDDALAREYARWCEVVRHQHGDCLGILEGSAILSRDARSTLALTLGMGAVLESMEAELRQQTDARAMVVTVGVLLAVYFTLLVFPDLATKGVAAVMTVVGVAYLTADVFFGILGGWRELMEATARARTFSELREAGEAFGRVMGQKAARVFVMLAMAALGGTAQQLAARTATLPGSAQAAVVGASQTGVNLGAVAAVESVAVNVVTGELVFTLAPNAMTMATDEGARSRPARLGQRHHIFSNKNYKSRARGGPWSPRFEEIFKKAGMDLDDGYNVIDDLAGHRGPHPREYHETVYRAAERATRRCTTISQCRKALIDIIGVLSKEISTPGTKLNLLATRKAKP